jgi:hypothetical protein
MVHRRDTRIAGPAANTRLDRGSMTRYSADHPLPRIATRSSNPECVLSATTKTVQKQ